MVSERDGCGQGCAWQIVGRQCPYTRNHGCFGLDTIDLLCCRSVSIVVKWRSLFACRRRCSRAWSCSGFLHQPLSAFRAKSASHHCRLGGESRWGIVSLHVVSFPSCMRACVRVAWLPSLVRLQKLLPTFTCSLREIPGFPFWLGESFLFIWVLGV